MCRLIMIGGLLVALVVAGLVAIGLAGMLAPKQACAQYGIMLDDARALGLIRAMAARDLVIGALLGTVALVASRDVLGWAMCLTALIAVVDLRVVMADRSATSRSRLGRATALHAGGAVGLLIVGALLLSGY